MGGIYHEFGKYTNAAAPSLLSRLDTRFRNSKEQDIARVLIGVVDARCEVGLVYSYDERFKGGPFDWKDENASTRSGELSERVSRDDYVTVECKITPALTLDFTVEGNLIRTHDEREYYAEAVYLYLYGR